MTMLKGKFNITESLEQTVPGFTELSCISRFCQTNRFLEKLKKKKLKKISFKKGKGTANKVIQMFRKKIPQISAQC